MRKKIFTFLLALVTSVGLSWATDPIVITTNTSQSSYTQGDITITCSNPGDNEGFYLQESGNGTATITNSGSSTISQIELGIGWFPDDRAYVRANGAEPTSSDEYSITFSNVNSNNVTLTITNGLIQISDVTITLADEGGSDPSANTITWNQSKLSSMTIDISSGSDSQTSDGITVTAVSNGERIIVFGGDQVDIQIGNGEDNAGGYITFESSVGKITQIDINHWDTGGWSNANAGWPSPYYETFDGGTFTWSGTPAASVTLTGDAPMYIWGITSIAFTIEDGGGSPTPTDMVLYAHSDQYGTPSDYYSTFYHPTQNYVVPEGTVAYAAVLSDGVLELNKVASGNEILPAETAVILKANSGTITLTPTSDAASYEGANSLRGTDTVDGLATPANCYVLNDHSTDGTVTGIGFYPYSAATMTAHRAFVTISNPNNAPRRLIFHTDEEQGIDEISQKSKVESRKIIENGQVFIIRNGVRYNTAGQIVK